MSQSITVIGYFILSLSAHGPSHAVNLFRDLDYPSLEAARNAVQSALEGRAQGEAERWSVRGVAKGAVVPIRTWKSQSGHWCREFEETLQLSDGREQKTRAVRCRSSDGRWKLIGE